MTSHVRCTLLIAASLSIAGCRQADGPLPTPSQERQNEIGDISRDLQSIARRDAEGANDLTEDLGKYAEAPAVRAAVDELSRRTVAAVEGSTLTEQTAQRLAHNLWLAISAREISERQVETLQNDLQGLLMSAGVAEERAEPVAQQVEEIQRLATTRPKRWYELF